MITRELETKYGKVLLSVLSDCTASVESRANRGGGFTINSIKFFFSVRLNLVEGKWVCDTRYLYSNRLDFKDITSSAGRKLVIEVNRVVTDCITANPQLLFDAEISIREDRRKKLEKLIEVKRQELQELEHELNELNINSEPVVI